MNETDNPSPLQLAPPGAGLPQSELFLAGLLFGWTNWRATRARSTLIIEKERTRVLAPARACSDETASKRVLVQRLPGMEDSSRYWSVWMTLDHLRLVHNGIADSLDKLGRGIVPEGQARTAAVKPSSSVDKSVVAQFDRSCARLLESAAEIPDLNTEARYKHPWFGPLNAKGWYAMAGFHLSLHRQQIERILAKLKETHGSDA